MYDGVVRVYDLFKGFLGWAASNFVYLLLRRPYQRVLSSPFAFILHNAHLALDELICLGFPFVNVFNAMI